MNNVMLTTDAKYNSFMGINCSITAIFNGTKMSVPLAPDNTEYAEILRQVDAGTLTIADAD